MVVRSVKAGEQGGMWYPYHPIIVSAPQTKRDERRKGRGSFLSHCLAVRRMNGAAYGMHAAPLSSSGCRNQVGG